MSIRPLSLLPPLESAAPKEEKPRPLRTDSYAFRAEKSSFPTGDLALSRWECQEKYGDRYN